MNINMPTSLAGGRYQLGQLVGRGGMAEVHVATDTRLGRTVAVKIMRADFLYALFQSLFSSCIANRTRRCTGFRPSRASGNARPTITLIA